jgi:DEAD/DEAH box helicase domain-containing protein
LFGGNILGVVATNALELGIDVGDLDVTIHVGFPGSLASLWQQAGRAGRRCNHSAAILMLDSDPLDAFYARKPDLVAGRTFERALLNVESRPSLDLHLQCAATEMMIRLPHDEYWFGREIQATCEQALICGREVRLCQIITVPLNHDNIIVFAMKSF